jgi:hypothetical protein
MKEISGENWTGMQVQHIASTFGRGRLCLFKQLLYVLLLILAIAISNKWN